jgi:hypothetical protein
MLRNETQFFSIANDGHTVRGDLHGELQMTLLKSLRGEARATIPCFGADFDALSKRVLHWLEHRPGNCSFVILALAFGSYNGQRCSFGDCIDWGVSRRRTHRFIITPPR